jgi:hypothetical protein
MVLDFGKPHFLGGATPAFLMETKSAVPACNSEVMTIAKEKIKDAAGLVRGFERDSVKQRPLSRCLKRLVGAVVALHRAHSQKAGSSIAVCPLREGSRPKMR